MASADMPVDPTGVVLPDDFSEQVASQLVAVGGANDKTMQEGAYNLWMLAAAKDRAEEAARQNAIIKAEKASATRHLLSMMKKGDEESKWRAARCLVQLAFNNAETCKFMAGTKVLVVAADLVKNLDGITDRVKEAALQLINNVASNHTDCHKTVIATDVLPHINAMLRSITIPEPVKRAGVSVVYAMTMSIIGRSELMELDAVSTLVPIIRSNKTTLNSMGATLAASNLIGHKVRAQMLSGCDVVLKVIKALEHALNREPLGGQYNSLRKVMMSFNELCKSDTHKDEIINSGGIVQLTRLCDLDSQEQHPDTMMFGCEAAWHLSFHPVGKSRLCESTVLVSRLQEMAMHDNVLINNNARGALFGMGIIPRPAFSESMSHIMLSFAEPQRERVKELKSQLESFGYVVWMDAPDGQMEEQFLQGVINAAVVCVCLSETYYTTARARSEFTLANIVSKFVVLLVVDDEGREDSWMNALMRGRITVDFAIPEDDEHNLTELVGIFEKNFGKRGKRIIHSDDASETKSVQSTTSARDSTEGSSAHHSAETPAAPQTQLQPFPGSAANGPGRDSATRSMTMEPPAPEAITGRRSEAVQKILDSRRVGANVIREWSASQVADWLSEIQLSQYAAVFLRHEVTGQVLLSMQDSYLSETLQVASKLHRKKILTRVYQIQ